MPSMSAYVASEVKQLLEIKLNLKIAQSGCPSSKRNV
jgi:hypothetical protein